LALDKLLARLTKDGSGTIDYIEWSNTLKMEHLSQLLPALGEKNLSEAEIKAIHAFTARVDEIAKLASDLNVRLMIDAEQTYFQPAIDNTVYGLMKKYNLKGKFTIFSTYQCYLKGTDKKLITDVERANRFKCNFGAKLVRGAYMVSERERAAEYNYEDPCHPNIEETHKCYHKCVDTLLAKINKTASADHGVEFMVASHNQTSVEYTIAKMKKDNVNKQSVYFGQLLGMSDHLTMTLGANGYLAYKVQLHAFLFYFLSPHSFSHFSHSYKKKEKEAHIKKKEAHISQ
jgi:proline dehydrogenase